MNFQKEFKAQFNAGKFPTPQLVQQNKIIAFILCLLFGFLGIHRFYLGKYITGTLQLLLGLIFIWGNYMWICFVFVILDLIRIISDPRFTKKLQITFVDIDIDCCRGTEYPNNSNEENIKELHEEEVEVTNHNPKEIPQEEEKK